MKSATKGASNFHPPWKNVLLVAPCLWSDSSNFRTWIFYCKATFSNIPPTPRANSCGFFSPFHSKNIQGNLVAELASIIGVVKSDLWMRMYVSSIDVHIHPDIGNSSRFLVSQGALLYIGHVSFNIECSAHHVARAACFGLHSLCLCPMKTLHISEIWDGECCDFWEGLLDDFICERMTLDSVFFFTYKSQVWQFSLKVKWWPHIVTCKYILRVYSLRTLSIRKVKNIMSSFAAWNIYFIYSI